jgi:hypothetical protein
VGGREGDLSAAERRINIAALITRAGVGFAGAATDKRVSRHASLEPKQ